MNKITTNDSGRVRFAILHHQPDPCESSDSAGEQFPEHWDFMIEQGESLATWQLQTNPTTDPAATITAVRIANHRKAYLEYEGPVSRGRGTVRRVESGTCAILEASNDRWLLDLRGGCLCGQYKLLRAQEDDRVAHLLWRWGKR